MGSTELSSSSILVIKCAERVYATLQPEAANNFEAEGPVDIQNCL